MAVTVHTPAAGTGRYPATAAALAFVDMNTADGDAFTLTGREIIIIRNTGVTSRNVTLQGVADDRGRTAAPVFAVAAGAVIVLGPLGLKGWKAANGRVSLLGAHADLEIAIYRMA